MDDKKLLKLFKEALSRTDDSKIDKGHDSLSEIPPLRISLDDKFLFRNELPHFDDFRDLKKISFSEEFGFPPKDFLPADFLLPPKGPQDYPDFLARPGLGADPGNGRKKTGSLLQQIETMMLVLDLLAITEDMRQAPPAELLKTAEERQRWIEENFGHMEIISSGKDFIVAMPDGYKLDFTIMSNHELDKIQLAEMVGLTTVRGRCIPNRIEVKADSRDEGIGRLYNEMCGNRDVRVYSPKAGQDPSVLVPGKEYHIVRRGDPLHDHASPDLIDFIFHETDMYTGRVHKGSLEGNHSHLINPKFV